MSWMDLASTLRRTAQDPDPGADEHHMENTSMRLAKLATTIRRKLAARPDVFPVGYAEGAITMRRAIDGMTISVTDEAMVEVTLPDGSVEVLDAVVDSDWSRKLDRTLAFGGLMPETVEVDFGLKIPLTAAGGSG